MRCRSSQRRPRLLPPALRDQAPEVPWNAIIGIGNVLRHDYQHLDDRRLWDVVTVHLPELRPAIQRMLNLSDD
ncbi:MAG TPA: HepT-like ribonuclease domain-containing protein [Methyloceanibacter sp.]